MNKRKRKKMKKLRKMRAEMAGKQQSLASFIHFIYTPFTGLGLNRNRFDDNWLAYRIEIFKNYTLKSLLNQTNRNFVHWISFRETDRQRPLIKELYEYMRNLKDYPFVFTFGGIAFWDDKYENNNLLERLKLTLPDLRKVCEGKEYVWETILASDDMAHKQAIQGIQEKELKQGKAFVHGNGYLFNVKTQRLAEWNPATNPPFYTIMYPMDVFLDPEKHFEYMKGFKSHEDIPKLFDCEKLPDGRYCYMVHKKNISTNWWHPFRGKLIDWGQGSEILKDFGIKVESPSEIKGNWREGKLIIKRWISQLLIKFGAYKYGWKIRQVFRKKIRYPYKVGKR